MCDFKRIRQPSSATCHVSHPFSSRFEPWLAPAAALSAIVYLEVRGVVTSGARIKASTIMSMFGLLSAYTPTYTATHGNHK